MKKNIAIFASGTGSNAANLIQFFKNHPKGHVSLIVSSSEKAGVNNIARENGIPLVVITKAGYTDTLPSILEENKIDLIVLAGFLWLIPRQVINRYEGRIVNIHPSLLPKYGGKGMYGSRVHEAVISSKESESGITIHLVNEHFDEGAPLHQEKCTVDPDDTPETLSKKIQKLEHQFFPLIVEQLLEKI